MPARPSTAREARVGSTSTGAAALCAGGAEPRWAHHCVVSVRQARRGAEIRHALAVRNDASTARPELSLAGKHRGDGHRDLRWLCSRRRFRHRRGALVLLVPLARDGGDAAACQPQHDSQGRARPTDHRLVQVRHRAERDDGVRNLLLSHRAHHRAGLREVEPDLLDLVHTLKGSRWQLFTKIQLPGALPYVFSGMKVAAILAVAGAIVGEFLGSDRGLGYLMLQVQVTLDTAAMFMAVILITLIGVVLYGMVLALERMLVVRDARIS